MSASGPIKPLGPFACRPLTRVEVARQLAEARIVDSHDLPGATLYALQADAHAWLLVALPGGTGLAIDLAKPAPQRRRSTESA